MVPGGGEKQEELYQVLNLKEWVERHWESQRQAGCLSQGHKSPQVRALLFSVLPCKERP